LGVEKLLYYVYVLLLRNESLVIGVEHAYEEVYVLWVAERAEPENTVNTQELLPGDLSAWFALYSTRSQVHEHQVFLVLLEAFAVLLEHLHVYLVLSLGFLLQRLLGLCDHLRVKRVSLLPYFRL